MGSVLQLTKALLRAPRPAQALLDTGGAADCAPGMIQRRSMLKLPGSEPTAVTPTACDSLVNIFAFFVSVFPTVKCR